jgi:hypothetical protein
MIMRIPMYVCMFKVVNKGGNVCVFGRYVCCTSRDYVLHYRIDKIDSELA